jgi:spore coat protein JB
MNEKQKLMRELQQTSFALYETVLYLDGHSCDSEALEYYKTAREKYECAKKAYEDKCGPICIGGVDTDKGWTWVETPWPWEMEAN